MTTANTASDFNDEDQLDDFSDPSYGGGKYENWSLKTDSVAAYRIFPAHQITASLAKTRDYAKYWATHFWKGRDPRNPAKLRSHPIFCIQEKDFTRGGMITRQCPLCVKREVYKKKVAGIEATGRSKNASNAAIAKIAAPYQQWLKDHGHDGKYRVYALNAQEQVGLLRLASRAMRSLRDQIKKLSAAGHSPLGAKGVWFQFTRVGNGGQTPDQVEPLRDERPDGSSVLRFHDLKKPLWETAKEVLPDMDEEIARITYPVEVLQALADSNDDPDEVNRILGIKSQESDSNFDAGSDGETGEGAPVDDDETDFSESASAKLPRDVSGDLKPQFSEQPSVPAKGPAVDENAELEAQIAALTARKTAAAAKAKAAGVAPSKPEPKAPPAPAADVSDEDFDKLFPPAK